MRVISIGTDDDVLREKSATHQRVREYAALVDAFHVLVPVSRTSRLPTTVRLGEHSWAHGISCRLRFAFFWKAIARARALMRDEHDWVVTTQDPFLCGFIGWIIAKKTGAALQVQMHTDAFDPFFALHSFTNRMYLFLAKFVLRKANRVRVVSERIAQSLRAWRPSLAERIDVLPIFVDIDAIKNSPMDMRLGEQLAPYHPIVLVASRLEPEKRIEDAIVAFADIREHYPHALLLIVGAGSQYESLVVAAQSLGSQVQFHTAIGNLAPYYRFASVYLLTSAYEGYSRSLLEAHAAGLPVVSADVGIAREVLQHAEDGAVVPVGDREALAQSLDRVLRKTTTPHDHTASPVGIALTKEAYLARYEQAWYDTLL